MLSSIIQSIAQRWILGLDAYLLSQTRRRALDCGRESSARGVIYSRMLCDRISENVGDRCPKPACCDSFFDVSFILFCFRKTSLAMASTMEEKPENAVGHDGVEGMHSDSDGEGEMLETILGYKVSNLASRLWRKSTTVSWIPRDWSY